MDRETTNPAPLRGTPGIRPRREPEAEAHFGALLDGDGLVLAVGGASLVRAGLVVESVAGMPLRDTVWWASSGPAQARLDAAIERARRGVSSSYRDELVSGPGSAALVEIQIVPVATGGELRIVVTAAETSAQKRRERALAVELASTDALSRARELGPDELLERLCLHLGFDAAELWLFEGADSVRIASHDHRAWLAFRLPPDERLPNLVRDRRAPVAVELDEADVESAGSPQSAIAIPIGGETRARGALVLFSSDPIAGDFPFMPTIASIARRIDEHWARRGADERRERALVEAQAASEAKSAFLATMSHEIRTPITAILGYADMLLTRAVDGADVQALEAIERSAQHLVRIVNDILDLTRIESGRLELREDAFSPADFVRDVRAMMRIAAEAKGIALEVSAHGPIPTAVRTDAARVRQIVVNLVDNAIKYTTRGSVSLGVAWIPEDSVLEFCVEDTGIGIAPGELERIFEPFAHADPSATREREGCGLGLAIARRLAQSLGGSLAVESRLGAGSAFTLRIACAPAPGASLEVPALGGSSRLSRPALETARLDGLRVLAVDDLREIRHIVQYYLEEAGAEVRTASDGACAVEEVARALEQGGPFDAMVLDMQMPNMDGWMAARKIRGMGQSIPIIALTASAMAGDRERALEAGCNDHVIKPIRPRELVHTVRKHAITRDRAHPQAAIEKHILFIDDDSDLREMMSLLLGSRGYRVSATGTCAGALEIALSDRPQIVLSDLSLPDGEGHELVATLRARLGATPPVVYIAVSGHDRVSALARVFDRLLQKPVRLPALVQAIEDVEAALAGAATSG